MAAIRPDRRQVVAGAGAALAAGAARGQGAWSAGPVAHLLPTAGHDALRLTVTTTRPLGTPPRLVGGPRAATARPTADGGRYWRFDLGGLRPSTAYDLRIETEAGATDAWTLRTLPAPDAAPGRLRILAFTCAGGADGPRNLAISARRRLLARGLSFSPDVAIVNGDHVYWDQDTAFRRPSGAETRALQAQIGLLDPAAGPASAENLRIVAEVGRRQIADLYRTDLRSTPVWFIRDDHDYFENDEFNDGAGTFPPTGFRRALTDALQAMYWPPFLDGAGLPGGGTSFGALRWGRLAEVLLYDCRGYLTDQGFLPPSVEAWIERRTRDARVRHVIPSPSTPWGWTAGKWGEWYPDVLDADGKLTTARAKAGWKAAWFEQHQRLLKLAGSRGRPAVALSGDLHAVGLGRIDASGGLKPAHPVHMVLTGPLGTGPPGFPSAFRGTRPQVAQAIQMATVLEPQERNGFTIVDVAPDEIRLRLFAWRPPEPVEAIETLAPIVDVTIPMES
ncbi:MAG: hypothetical protein JNK30_22305 [Phenylobacterium sp.]|uniref:hypothetical protein n=1 Tax=Phenylobacterium sp. TaxID=1871053 RepID=UPI001A477345|nr:hypothetical protein [Phenylobacterium sp.]MBL8774137.1 hypothetical protein [Phenylobacterium sp.]